MTKLVTQRQLGQLSGHGCVVVKMVRGFGPYAYLVKKHRGVQTWKYLGRVASEEEVLKSKVGKSKVGNLGVVP